MLFPLHLLLKLVINLLPSATRFSPGNFSLSIYTILSKSLYLILLVMFQLNSDIILFVNLSYRFNPSLLIWISHPSVCQGVNVIRSVFCHLHVPFLVKLFFTTVNFVHPVTLYIVKSINWAYHICRAFPSVQCTSSIHRHFSYQERENVKAFLCHY